MHVDSHHIAATQAESDDDWSDDTSMADSEGLLE